LIWSLLILDSMELDCWSEEHLLERDALRRRLANCRAQFYVYALCRIDGSPFYIGKGKGDRVLQHERDALGPALSYKLNTIRSMAKKGEPLRYRIIELFEDESQCHAREKAEILRIGRHDLGTGPLTNLTDGGEGTSGLSEETRRRIDEALHGPDAPGDRGVANRFLLELCQQVRSVPIRPLSLFKPLALKPHALPRKPTTRMAAALAASAIGGRIVLSDGCRLPRVFELEGVQIAIENGAGADILRAGMATLVPASDPADEQFELDGAQVQVLVEKLGSKVLLDAGVLMPTA